MFTRGLSQQTQKNLVILSKILFVSKYYLAGGTALSLHYGHRFSYDLDFFSLEPEKSFIITSSLKDKGKLEIFQNDEGTFNGQLNGIKLSFFIYPYKAISPFSKYNNIKVAGISDIACMKINAISSRGTKRDFVDLYSICKRDNQLARLLKLFEKKYAAVKYNMLHIIKSLVYFKDAEEEEMPSMVDEIDWKAVKKFFVQEVKYLKL